MVISYYVALFIVCAVAGFYFYRSAVLLRDNRRLRRELDQALARAARPRVKTYRGDWKIERDFADPDEPTVDELAEVYRSLGCEVPPSIQHKISERDQVLDEILADLEALEKEET